ncbi:hypothetical protein BJF78_34730 [Pseudonocardia sp. CNS-139]|nr:hypothetical protein BJF78_34730 [Pseudonocardia sp. CNS-139]
MPVHIPRPRPDPVSVAAACASARNARYFASPRPCVVVHGEMSRPPCDTSYAARAFSSGSVRSRPAIVRWASTLICQRPRESSPDALCAPLSPPDSASAIAVIVTAWSGVNPASTAKR